MKFVADFAHDYEIDFPNELPGDGGKGKLFYYPGAKESSGKDGVLVRVTPNERPNWLGMFAFGFMPEASEINGAYSCPNPISVCIVSNGEAYIVNSQTPKEWLSVPSEPVLDVRTHLGRQFLLFVDFKVITAWGPNGVVWTTDDLAADGVFITKIDDDHIYGFGTCLCTEDRPKHDFVVDMATGKHTGGWYG